MYRIAVNHQDDVPPKWHHKDGWPRKVISSRIDATMLIEMIIDMRPSKGNDQKRIMHLLSRICPALTVQTVLAVLEDRYLYVDEWEPAPHGMIITFPPESGTISVPANSHARRLE